MSIHGCQDAQHDDILESNTQNNGIYLNKAQQKMTLNLYEHPLLLCRVLLCQVSGFYCYAECRYAECH